MNAKKTFIGYGAIMALLCGAAFAQTNMPPAAGATSEQPAAPPMQPDSSMSPAPAVEPAAPAAPAASSTTMTTTTTTASTPPAAAPQESYPVCTAKLKDHCVNRSQESGEATTTRTHRMKHTSTTQTTPAPGV